MPAVVRPDVDDRCRGMILARETALRMASLLTFEDINPQIRIGAFLKPLPRSGDETRRVYVSLFSMAMFSDARWLDTPPRVETAFGDIPVLLIERCAFLVELHGHLKGRGGKDEKLVAAAVVLRDQLIALEQSWLAKMDGLWRKMRHAEQLAASLLHGQLALNRWYAEDARARYLYPDRDPALPRATDPDFLDLRRAIRVVAAARERTDLDAIRTEQTVVTAVATGLTVIAVASALQRSGLPGRGLYLDRELDPALDRKAWDEIEAANRLSTEAVKHTVEAAAAYIQVLRREAEAHPLLCVLDHRDLADANPLHVARAIEQAVRAAEEAIASFRATAVNSLTFDEARRAEDLTCSGLARSIAESSAVSVWKLPFFMERTLLELPPGDALEVRAVMELAGQGSGGKAIAKGLALSGIDAAMMVAPEAGPIGLGLAIAWALVALGRSIHEYTQLSMLYHATIDPAALFRGLDHDDASKFSLVMDLIGVLFVKR